MNRPMKKYSDIPPDAHLMPVNWLTMGDTSEFVAFMVVPSVGVPSVGVPSVGVPSVGVPSVVSMGVVSSVVIGHDVWVLLRTRKKGFDAVTVKQFKGMALDWHVITT